MGCGGVGKIIFLERLKGVCYLKFKYIKSIVIVDVYLNCFEVLEEDKIIKCNFL